MQDKNGRTIRERDKVRFHYPRAERGFVGRVTDCTSHRAKQLGACLVDFKEAVKDAGTPQYVWPGYLEVLDQEAEAEAEEVVP